MSAATKHPAECGKDVSGTGMKCHLDRNHEGPCIWGIMSRAEAERRYPRVIPGAMGATEDAT